MLKRGVHQKGIERTIHNGKVHLDVMAIILVLKYQFRGSVKILTAISKQFFWGGIKVIIK